MIIAWIRNKLTNLHMLWNFIGVTRVDDDAPLKAVVKTWERLPNISRQGLANLPRLCTYSKIVKDIRKSQSRSLDLCF